MYVWVNGRFRPQDYPLGIKGPTLDASLQIPKSTTRDHRVRRFKEKCAFGLRCKFQHPERGLTFLRTVPEKSLESFDRYLLQKEQQKKVSPTSSDGTQNQQQQKLTSHPHQAHKLHNSLNQLYLGLEQKRKGEKNRLPSLSQISNDPIISVPASLFDDTEHCSTLTSQHVTVLWVTLPSSTLASSCQHNGA